MAVGNSIKTIVAEISVIRLILEIIYVIACMSGGQYGQTAA